MCIYKEDSKPVFLSICKQSACSQNSCLNLTQLYVRNKCFVSRSMLVEDFKPDPAFSEIDGKLTVDFDGAE